MTEDEKQQRAKEIAEVLSANERWHSHGRMISRDTLTVDPIRLQIEKIEDTPNLSSALGKLRWIVQRLSSERTVFFVCTHPRIFLVKKGGHNEELTPIPYLLSGRGCRGEDFRQNC